MWNKSLKLGELATDSRGELATYSHGKIDGWCPSLSEFKDIVFDGERISVWKNFILVFEKVCQTKGWDGVQEETLVELVTSRLVDKARKAWDEWVQEDPEIMGDYFRLKKSFIERLGEDTNPWKRLVDFQNLVMGGDENIEVFSRKYLAAADAVDVDGCAVVKYYFALPSKIRELINRSTGEWPHNLKEMIKLSKEVVMKDESVNFVRVPVRRDFEKRSLANVVCLAVRRRCLEKQLYKNR